jgi:poly-gamma-glutamate synthesis protein (capsule biosynthesis protein)
MDNIRIACVGDIMCGDSFSRIGMGVTRSLDKYGRGFVPPDIIDIFKRHNLVLCNLECVFSDIGRKEKSLRSLHMRGRPKTIQYLADWGITAANVANNHILEQGQNCAIDTVLQLNKAGIKAIGAGKRGLFEPGIEAAEIDFGGQEMAVLGLCLLKEKYTFNGGGSLNEVLEAVKTKAREGNFVIVSVHWGDEMMDRPSLEQRKTARLLVDAGAKLVVGHHPHIIQGVENVGSGLVAYSLGNFIFDGSSEATGWSMILSIAVSAGEIVKWEGIPIIRGDDYRPALASGIRKEDLERRIVQRCDILKQEIQDNEYEEKYVLELQEIGFQSKRRLRRNLLKRFIKYPPIYWPQIIFRPIQRRLRTW